MASPYLSFYPSIRQYYCPSNQGEHPKSKFHVLEKNAKNVGTASYRSVRCVAAKPIGAPRVHKSPEVDGLRTKDVATVLGIGTANPPNVMYQDDYPDVYFRATKSEHMTSYKEKFKRMCEKSMIKKRHFLWDIEAAEHNENLAMNDHMSPSFDMRRELVAMEIPKLGHQAALKAISDWGQSKSKITHLIFATCTGLTVPGADFQLAKLLGLSPSIKRHMIYMQGCYAGGTGLRLAKDLAENNKDARVLVVCCEMVTMGTRGPSESDVNALVAQALFADGAAAVIVGDGKSVDDHHNEKPLFQLVSTDQTVLPNSENSITATYCEAGLVAGLEKDVPFVIANNIEHLLLKTIKPFGISNDWNNLFWMTHPGGRAILDMIEKKLGLDNDKLEASRHILSEYGNMSSPSVIFVMEAIRKMSMEKGKATTGDGFDWGVLLAMGPGITVETILVHSLPL